MNLRLWKRLEAASHMFGPRRPIVIVSCGWDPRDPRRDEYKVYLDAWTVGTPDPAFTQTPTAGSWEVYSFDHTKVPKGASETEIPV